MGTNHNEASGNGSCTTYSPFKRGGHRIVWQIIVCLFKNGPPAFVVNANEQLRLSLAGNPGLNINDIAVPKHLVVRPTVQFAIRPVPKPGTSTHHHCGLLSVQVSTRTMEGKKIGTLFPGSQFPKRCHLPDTFSYEITLKATLCRHATQSIIMAKVLTQITLKLPRLMQASEYGKLRHVGRKEQEIAPGISGERKMMSGTRHSDKLRDPEDLPSDTR
ncbi:hypothetical protein [Pseudomonas sp. Pseusp16]|uniref:hypothetical protein n=1 Tax=Pseudomonas sp. Pseusp16 TaxID=3243021 RepID=UPI0039B4DDFF